MINSEDEITIEAMFSILWWIDWFDQIFTFTIVNHSKKTNRKVSWLTFYSEKKIKKSSDNKRKNCQGKHGDSIDNITYE